MSTKKVSTKALESLKRSICPVTSSLDIFGDKWTLLVIRDLFLGCTQYGDFLKSPEGIPTNILAERLKRLECFGILEKSPYQEKPVRYAYRLTQKGQALAPILIEMVKWGNQHIPGTMKPTKEMIEKFKSLTNS